MSRPCLSCPNPRAPGHARCAACLEKARRKRAAKVRAGICARCAERAAPGVRVCARHRDYEKACNLRKKLRKAGAPPEPRGNSILSLLNDYDAKL